MEHLGVDRFVLKCSCDPNWAIQVDGYQSISDIFGLVFEYTLVIYRAEKVLSVFHPPTTAMARS